MLLLLLSPGEPAGKSSQLPAPQPLISQRCFRTAVTVDQAIAVLKQQVRLDTWRAPLVRLPQAAYWAIGHPSQDRIVGFLPLNNAALTHSLKTYPLLHLKPTLILPSNG